MATKIFKTKISSVRLTLSPFSAEQMYLLGELMIQKKSKRIAAAMDSEDNPTKPLRTDYLRRKIRRNRAPLRDWNWRGLTMRSLKVLAANQNRVTIGFANPQADMIVTVQNRKNRMWQDSPSDERFRSETVKELLQQPGVIKFQKTKRTA